MAATSIEDAHATHMTADPPQPEAQGQPAPRARPLRERQAVVIGGGFAGIACAKALGRAGISATVVDRRNHHLFQPLLYQVATAALSPADIAQPIRHILSGHGSIDVVMGEVASVDAAALEQDGKPLPAMAQVAKQQGQHLGKELAGLLGRGQTPAPFRFRDRGNTAVIGRHAAVFDIGGRLFKGRLAWLMWAVVHVYLLVGLERRLLVTLQWIWRYFTYQRGSRLIR